MKTLIQIVLTAMCALISGCATEKRLSDGDAPVVSATVAQPPPNQSKDSWIHEPDNFPGDMDGSQIDRKAYWQTQMTKLPMAIRMLDDKTIVGLTDKDARYYAGSHYSKQLGTRPYLVRAVFWNYTGEFSLFLRDGDLFVSHYSLGHINGETKLPFVVNLRQPPNHVYTYMGSAL